ncbi:MAG TPA: hypothetical protein VNG33_17600 [Polyangiaceae bacterium]|nr:hypothetical protein [Polyangiaceae bacterium]
MSEAAEVERPAWRISFRLLMGFALGLALVALVAGRYVYKRYGSYTPLALAHVPANMRYRARVELNDSPRAAALVPLLNALDPRHKRLPQMYAKLGVSGKTTTREVAFGVGPEPFDFVVVLGLSLPAGTGPAAGKALCESLASDGIRSQPTENGCQLAEGGLVAGTPDGAIVVASRAALVSGLLGAPDIGDRLGFWGPSERGAAPEVGELGSEASTLARRIAANYP